MGVGPGDRWPCHSIRCSSTGCEAAGHPGPEFESRALFGGQGPRTRVKGDLSPAETVCCALVFEAHLLSLPLRWQGEKKESRTGETVKLALGSASCGGTPPGSRAHGGGQRNSAGGQPGMKASMSVGWSDPPVREKGNWKAHKTSPSRWAKAPCGPGFQRWLKRRVLCVPNRIHVRLGGHRSPRAENSSNGRHWRLCGYR